jgi:hypothetical protein
MGTRRASYVGVEQKIQTTAFGDGSEVRVIAETHIPPRLGGGIPPCRNVMPPFRDKKAEFHHLTRSAIPTKTIKYSP